MSSSEEATDGSTLVEPSSKKVKFETGNNTHEGGGENVAATVVGKAAEDDADVAPATRATNNGGAPAASAENNKSNNNLSENNNSNNNTSSSSCARVTKSNADGGAEAPVANKNSNNSHAAKEANKKKTAGDQEADDDDEDGVDDEDGADDDGPDLDPTIAKCLEDVEMIQNEIEKLNEIASEEILKVEQRFNQLRKPHYEKRNELLQGIPNFWISTFINHPNISSMLDEDDEDCLHYLTRLDVEEFEDIKSGYRIKFHFQENPYFTNNVLVKELDLRSRVYPSSNSTKINFKDTEQANRLKENCLVAREVRLRNSSARQSRQQDPRTFFSWFLDNTDAFADDIAEALKEEIWPNPLQYYLIQDESGAVNDSDEEDDEDDEDDEAVVIDEDDDEEDGEGDMGEAGDDDDDDDDGDDSEVLDGSNSESSGQADAANDVQYAD